MGCEAYSDGGVGRGSVGWLVLQWWWGIVIDERAIVVWGLCDGGVRGGSGWR